MKPDQAIKVDCNRYHNGQCSTRACLIRGGWSPGDDYDKSLANATCDAHEIITLRARVKELEEIEIHLGGRVEDQRSKIRNLEERMANAAGKVLELARFIREMEANEEAWKLKESQIACDNLKQESRIRELEEAMPTAQQMRNLANSFDGGGMFGCAKGAWAMADRIDKVMRKEGNERP